MLVITPSPRKDRNPDTSPPAAAPSFVLPERRLSMKWISETFLYSAAVIVWVAYELGSFVSLIDFWSA